MLENVVKRSEFGYTREWRYTKVIYYLLLLYAIPYAARCYVSIKFNLLPVCMCVCVRACVRVCVRARDNTTLYVLCHSLRTEAGKGLNTNYRSIPCTVSVALARRKHTSWHQPVQDRCAASSRHFKRDGHRFEHTPSIGFGTFLQTPSELHGYATEGA